MYFLFAMFCCSFALVCLHAPLRFAHLFAKLVSHVCPALYFALFGVGKNFSTQSNPRNGLNNHVRLRDDVYAKPAGNLAERRPMVVQLLCGGNIFLNITSALACTKPCTALPTHHLISPSPSLLPLLCPSPSHPLFPNETSFWVTPLEFK